MTEIEDEKVDAGTILQEIQAGYMLGERLLRPALVGVAKKKQKKRTKMIKKSENKPCRDKKSPIYQRVNQRNL